MPTASHRCTKPLIRLEHCMMAGRAPYLSEVPWQLSVPHRIRYLSEQVSKCGGDPLEVPGLQFSMPCSKKLPRVTRVGVIERFERSGTADTRLGSTRNDRARGRLPG